MNNIKKTLTLLISLLTILINVMRPCWIKLNSGVLLLKLLNNTVYPDVLQWWEIGWNVLICYEKQRFCFLLILRYNISSIFTWQFSSFIDMFFYIFFYCIPSTLLNWTSWLLKHVEMWKQYKRYRIKQHGCFACEFVILLRDFSTAEMLSLWCMCPAQTEADLSAVVGSVWFESCVGTCVVLQVFLWLLVWVRQLSQSNWALPDRS